MLLSWKKHREWHVIWVTFDSKQLWKKISKFIFKFSIFVFFWKIKKSFKILGKCRKFSNIITFFRKPYSKLFARFLTVFVDFDREDFILNTFDKIFCVRLALPHFLCISYIFWKSTHHGEILDFVSKYCRKREVNDWIPTHNTWITMFSTVFSTQNPRFLHDELIFRKNMIYMKNAEEQAGLKIFCQKSWEWSPPCQN